MPIVLGSILLYLCFPFILFWLLFWIELNWFIFLHKIQMLTRVFFNFIFRFFNLTYMWQFFFLLENSKYKIYSKNPIISVKDKSVSFIHSILIFMGMYIDIDNILLVSSTWSIFHILCFHLLIKIQILMSIKNSSLK